MQCLGHTLKHLQIFPGTPSLVKRHPTSLTWLRTQKVFRPAAATQPCSSSYLQLLLGHRACSVLARIAGWHRSASYMWAGHMHPVCLLLTYDWVSSPSGALSLRLLACADALNASHKVLLCRGFLGCRLYGNQHKQRGRPQCCIHRHCTINTVKTCTTIFTSRSS